ncbi:MAG: ferritin-like domain-containing protein [Candidatus Bathyarchaeota archaeon]|nr:ferritin-like domain-containing protein [Candidatus Bathyarchaeota archaeon]
MASKSLVELLNDALARELQVSIQYMWQYVQVTGVEGAVVKGIFRETAFAEMRHAEKIAQRLDFLDSVPTTEPQPVFVGGSLLEMLSQDQHDEETAIETYKRGINLARKEGDYATAHLLEEILSEEEKHIDTFGKLLVGKTDPFTQPDNPT